MVAIACPALVVSFFQPRHQYGNEHLFSLDEHPFKGIARSTAHSNPCCESHLCFSAKEDAATIQEGLPQIRTDVER